MWRRRPSEVKDRDRSEAELNSDLGRTEGFESKKISRKCYVGKLPNACITLLDSLEGSKCVSRETTNTAEEPRPPSEDGRRRTRL